MALWLLFSYFSANSIKNNAARENASEWEQHSLQVVIEARGLLSALQGIDAGERGYLLTGDNPRQQDARKGLGDIVTQRLDIGTATVEARRAHQKSLALSVARA